MILIVFLEFWLKIHWLGSFQEDVLKKNNIMMSATKFTDN